MKQKLQKVASQGMLNQAKRFSRFIFAAVLAFATLPAFAAPNFVVTVNTSYTYDGTAKEPQKSDLTVKYDPDDGSPLVDVADDDYDIDAYGSSNTNAGTGTATVDVKGNTTGAAYGSSVTGTGTFSIGKATPATSSLDGTSYTVPAGFDYDGTDHSVSISPRLLRQALQTLAAESRWSM